VGTYDPRRYERDACGIGFVADAHGRASHQMVEHALEALRRVRHRGATASDERTGDGAGLLLPIGLPIVAPDHAELGDRVGVAMVFGDPADPDGHRRAVAEACEAEGLDLVRWRPVPVDPEALGDQAGISAPAIEQAVVLRPVGSDVEDGERRAFRARRRIEAHARTTGSRTYVASLSFRTITYKALCAADQLAEFYPDLKHPAYEAWFAIFHQRYSTNTSPTWERAQPFRFIGHNGEINTIRGNQAWMRAREGRLGAEDLAPEDLLVPVVDPDSSDSGMLDEALELLTRGGRDLRHAATMLVPSAWEGLADLDEDLRSFFRYHSTLMEPWDGPAALVMTDGVRVVAQLDRNGLRPLRLSICDDGLVVCASEVGVVPTRGHGRVERAKVGPGEIFSVDPSEGGILRDGDIKRRLAQRRPYSAWVEEHMTERSAGVPHASFPNDVGERQVATGYTKEEFTVVIRPMATEGAEPTSSMGDDTAQAPLSEHRRSLFGFLKQRFAQVTNPPIDHLRERHVMSISSRLGTRAELLHERPDSATVREYPSFVVFPSAVQELIAEGAELLDATFDVGAGPGGLHEGCENVAQHALAAVEAGCDLLVISDAAMSETRVPIPSALAAGMVHHRLITHRVRSLAGIVVDAADVRETHHAACLVTNGADLVSPRLALQSIAELAKRGRLGGGVDVDQAQRNFVHAIEDGLMKVMSKMGIATVDSYRGAQIIEAMGLGSDVIESCFPGVESTLDGLTFEMLGEDALARHEDAYAAKPVLANTGFIKFKRGGEFHALNPDVIDSLHGTVGLKSEHSSEEDAAHALRRAARGDDPAYRKFADITDGRPASEPRDLLDLVPAGPPVPLEEVEPASEIARRFSTGAMSHGALSAESHETLSVALNMIGGMANTGEGGESRERFRDQRNSGIKQIASGRFGVTPEYVGFARELQIKMAQGSKPGEGGQIPGKKVTDEIARLRHTVPGIALVSPPPHHDIYSIEDLAQLIYDLKQANAEAAVSVKLVASEGVGTIAAGVVKGLADVVHISGGDGGTGASPLSSIKNAGMPWEIGLAETQRALVENGLRGRARVRVDGGLKTGRDIMLAALLGADEFSFGTAALVAEGCILVRTCHRNTCPVGIATQDPALRAKFAGTPEMVARYLMLVAEDVRLLLSSLGVRTLDEAIGRTDLLKERYLDARGARSLDVGPLLFDASGREQRFTGPLDMQRPRSELGDRLFAEGFDALRSGETIELSYGITNADRTVGARLGVAAGVEFGADRPAGHVRAAFTGEAGQSFGALLSEGIELALTGEANDYVAKGMGGGRIVIAPPANDVGDPYLVGNTVLYGATGGQLYVAGRAGERFAVRNSGAVSVVEGAGDHACEYMTAGAVVILGPVGRNMGAGMSGGEAYVYDPERTLEGCLNRQLVAAYEPTIGQLTSLERVIRRHFEATGSPIAGRILQAWDEESQHFRRVAPKAEVARLEALFEGTTVSSA
jgi:glutamate synthase domain-containing protein 2/glutamate synthase domain-containing protein 1/glutamate synthase domain-containing protein 3